MLQRRDAFKQKPVNHSRTMHKSVIHAAVAITLLASVAADAQSSLPKGDRRVEGAYESRALHARVILLDYDKGIAAVSVAVTSNGCTGSVVGLAEMTDNKLVISPYEKLEGGEACQVILVDGSKSWKKVTATDNGKCNAYHGASCTWAGQSAKKVEK